MENTNGTHEDVASSLSEETRSFQEGSSDAVRRGFRSVVLAGCEFLVGITPEGMMDLREVYVHDSTTGIYGKPEYVGDPPSGPAHYFEAPWEHVQPGDPVTYKERKVELLKLYLIEEKNKHPLELNLKEVFCLDGKRQQVQHLAVKGSEAANPRDTRLVIREGEIFLGNIRELPTPTQIFNDMKRAEEEGRRPIHHQQGIQSDEEDEELDFEEYDVPEVDML